MNWISIGLAALSGALAGSIASILIRNPKEKRVQFAIVFVVCFAVIQALSREYLFPDINAWNQARNAESALLEIPAFRAIKQYDPSTYESLVSDLQDLIKKGNQSQILGGRYDESQIIGLIRGHIVRVIQKRIPIASDEAVVSYVNVIVTEIRELRDHGGDLCYQFLFPQPSNPFDGRKYFSKQTQEADLSALAQVIRSSAENPQPIPLETEIGPILEPVITDLAKEHGSDINLLQNPVTSSIDKAKVCSITLDLYSRILKLPKNDSSKVLRFMLSQT